jgi:outer membrane protein OmpA-like peptidoglycan-associated protein
MRSVSLFTVLMLTTVPVFAQNYVAPKNYNNPDVVVNMDVIGNGIRPTMARQPIQPRLPITPPEQIILSEPLPLLQQPAPKLVAPAEIPPVSQYMMESKPPLADIPPPPVAMPVPVAPPMALAKPLPKPIPTPDFVPAPKVIAEKDNAPLSLVPDSVLKDPIELPLPKPQPQVQSKVQENPARELLAAARAEVAETAPPAPAAVEKPRERIIFDEAPAQITEVLPTQKPAAKPVVQKPVAEEVSDINAPVPGPVPVIAPAAALNPSPVAEDETSAATLVDDFEAYRLAFAADSSELTPSEKAVLDKIVGKMKSEEKTRLQLRAYAGGSPDTTSAARRLSLSRALNVRSYLSEKGVAPSRLDVRAFGMATAPSRPDIPADRVDVIFIR